MGLRERRGGGGVREEEKVNNFFSLGFELNTAGMARAEGSHKDCYSFSVLNNP